LTFKELRDTLREDLHGRVGRAATDVRALLGASARMTYLTRHEEQQ